MYAAHRLVEQLTLDRDLMHLRDRLAPEVAEMVYYGFWYTAKMDALMAFIREAQKNVTGEVSLNLYKGNIMVDGRSSPNSLYDEGHRQHGRGRQLQPDRRRRILADSRSAGPRAGARESAEVLSRHATLRRSLIPAFSRREKGRRLFRRIDIGAKINDGVALLGSY